LLNFLRDALEHLESAVYDDTRTAVTDPINTRQTGVEKRLP
jgi:hypothetical protein